MNICLAAGDLHDVQVGIKRGGLGLGLTIPHFCDCPKAGPKLYPLLIIQMNDSCKSHFLIYALTNTAIKMFHSTAIDYNILCTM